MLEGLRLAWDKGFKKVIVELDVLNLVQNIMDVKIRDNRCHPLLMSIRNLSKQDWHVSFRFIHKSGNECVDHLARWEGRLVGRLCI